MGPSSVLLARLRPRELHACVAGHVYLNYTYYIIILKDAYGCWSLMLPAIFLLSIIAIMLSQLNNCLPKRFLCEKRSRQTPTWSGHALPSLACDNKELR